MIPTKDLKQKIDQLIKKRISNRMKINVKISYIKKMYERYGSYAWCENLDMFERNPRNFVISVDEDFLHGKTDKELFEFYVTIAHELVHVQQYARNRLREGTHGVQIWEGAPVDENLEYEKLPWEIEAYAKEYEWACDLI